MATTRGIIISPERARQIKDFSGLLFGTITPTDIDGFIEYQDKAHIVIELKMKGVEVPYGQKLALERLVDDLHIAGKPSLCIIAEHETMNTDRAIDVASAIVVEYRYTKKWFLPPRVDTVRQIIERFLELNIK